MPDYGGMAVQWLALLPFCVEFTSMFYLYGLPPGIQVFFHTPKACRLDHLATIIAPRCECEWLFISVLALWRIGALSRLYPDLYQVSAGIGSRTSWNHCYTL